MSKYFNNIKEIIDSNDISEDDGITMLEYIIVAAVMASVAILVFNLFGDAIFSKGQEVSKGIEESDIKFKPKS